MFDVDNFTPIVSWQSKVSLKQYQSWVQSVEKNSSDLSSIENILFLLQQYIFETDYDGIILRKKCKKTNGKLLKWLSI